MTPLLLSAWLTLAGCADGVRPPTPRAARLGEVRTPTLPSLSPDAPRPARGFLLPSPLFEQRDGAVHLDALLDGALEGGLTLGWTAEGGDVVPGPGGTAQLRPTSAVWSVEARLERRGREVARAEARAPATRSADLSGWQPPHRRPVPLEANACREPHLPGRFAAGHVGCSGGEVPSIDRFLPWGGAAPTKMPALPRRAGQKQAPSVRPADAALGESVLAWAGQELGTWAGPAGGSARWLPTAGLLGAPAVGPRHLAVLRKDRVEIAVHGASQRSLLAAEPVDAPGAAAVEHPWLALLEGQPGAARLGLRDLSRNRVASIGAAADRWDLQLRDGWLTWQEGPDVCWLDLTRGELRRTRLASVRGRRSVRFDDLLLLPTLAEQGVEVTALHLPSGEHTTLFADGGDVRLRGAAAGGVTVAAGPFGVEAELLSLSPRRRIIEEQGGALPRRQGGHGGEHAWLAEGRSSRSLDPGPGDVSLAAWRPDSGGAGRVEAWRGGERLSGFALDADGPAGWIDLGEAAEPAGRGQDQRRIELRWIAGDEGIAVDAVRLSAAGAP